MELYLPMPLIIVDVQLEYIFKNEIVQNEYIKLGNLPFFIFKLQKIL